MRYYFAIVPRFEGVSVTQVPVRIRLAGYAKTYEDASYRLADDWYACASSRVFDQDVTIFDEGRNISGIYGGPNDYLDYDRVQTFSLEVAKTYGAEVYAVAEVRVRHHSAYEPVDYSDLYSEAMADPLIEIDPAFPEKDSFMIVFSENLSPPRLTMTPQGTNALLSWPASHPGFTLQSCTNPGPSAVWNPVPITPVTVEGQNIVTNPITGTNTFFRLLRPTPQ